MPGEHGLVGYRVLDAAHDRLVNQLSGWDAGMRPETWQRLPTLFETAHERGHRDVRRSGPPATPTRASRARCCAARSTAPGATIADRFAEAVRVAGARGEPRRRLPLRARTRPGGARARVAVRRWLGLLEQLDAELAAFERRMPRGAGLLVTADHGVIDVPAHRHVFIDDRPELLDGVRHVGRRAAVPRAVLRARPRRGRRAPTLVERWRAAEEHRAWVLDRDEAIARGLYGAVAAEVRRRIGDILVAARAGIAYYDRREPNRQAEAMIGQHGSLSDEETRVPLVRAECTRDGDDAARGTSRLVRLDTSDAADPTRPGIRRGTGRA